MKRTGTFIISKVILPYRGLADNYAKLYNEVNF